MGLVAADTIPLRCERLERIDRDIDPARTHWYWMEIHAGGGASIGGPVQATVGAGRERSAVRFVQDPASPCGTEPKMRDGRSRRGPTSSVRSAKAPDAHSARKSTPRHHDAFVSSSR